MKIICVNYFTIVHYLIFDQVILKPLESNSLRIILPESRISLLLCFSAVKEYLFFDLFNNFIGLGDHTVDDG
jgi:hypothetical protein